MKMATVFAKTAMGLTKPIPAALRAEMEHDPFYQRCCVTGVRRGPYAKIEWHHNLKYAGERVNEKWCILPVLKRVHDKADTRIVREFLDWIMLNRADDETLKRFSKAGSLIERRDRLNKIYGDKKNHPLL